MENPDKTLTEMEYYKFAYGKLSNILGNISKNEDGSVKLYNIKYGELRNILIELQENDPEYIAEGFGNNYYYGCPEHAMYGDAWFYGDCPEAW